MSEIAPNTEIGLVRLTVRDIGRARRFYETGLGFQVAKATAGRLTLCAPDGPPLIEIRGNRNAPPLDRDRPGLFHIGVLLPSRRHLAIALFRLAHQGIGLTGASDHLFSESIYVEDPEGNGISISRDRHRSSWPRDEQGRPTRTTLALDLKDIANEVAAQLPLPEQLTRIPPGTRVGHIHLQVSELRRTEAFYAGVLGFDVTFRDPGGALYLSAGGYHHHLGFNTWRSQGADPPPDGTAGLRSFELRLPTSSALAEVIDRIVADELPLSEVEEGALVRDPSGNSVILTG